MSAQTEYRRAKATFYYKVGAISDTITVGCESNKPKNRDNWLFSLAIQAGQSVAEIHGADAQAIAFSLSAIELE